MVRSGLLTFNCHEAWVHQLSWLNVPVDVIDGLSGRYTRSWDTRMRPRPPQFRFITLKEALEQQRTYDCIIGHNLTDLLEVKSLRGPRMLMLHVTLEHRLSQMKREVDADEIRQTIRQYLQVAGGYAVAVTESKHRSWGLGGEVVESAVDVHSYPQPTRHVAAGIRVSNQIMARQDYLWWKLHAAAFESVPVRLVGHNPDMPGVRPSRDWNDLKALLSRHRFFIHTANPTLEDGFNMALMEAAAAGLARSRGSHRVLQ